MTGEPLPYATGAAPPPAQRQVALIDLLDRLLSSGVVVTGDVTLSIADIDLVRISLRALIVSISAEHPAPWESRGPLPPPEDHVA